MQHLGLITYTVTNYHRSNSLETEVLDRTEMHCVHIILMQSQLRCAGHVARMPDHKPPKSLFYGELEHEKRSRGGLRKRFKDIVNGVLY